MFAVYGNKMWFEMRGLWREQRKLGKVLVHSLAIDNFADLRSSLRIVVSSRETWSHLHIAAVFDWNR